MERIKILNTVINTSNTIPANVRHALVNRLQAYTFDQLNRTRSQLAKGSLYRGVINEAILQKPLSAYAVYGGNLREESIKAQVLAEAAELEQGRERDLP